MLKLKSQQFRFQFKAVFSRFLIDFEDYLRVLLKTKEKKRDYWRVCLCVSFTIVIIVITFYLFIFFGGI